MRRRVRYEVYTLQDFTHAINSIVYGATHCRASRNTNGSMLTNKSPMKLFVAQKNKKVILESNYRRVFYVPSLGAMENGIYRIC